MQSVWRDNDKVTPSSRVCFRHVGGQPYESLALGVNHQGT